MSGRLGALAKSSLGVALAALLLPAPVTSLYARGEDRGGTAGLHSHAAMTDPEATFEGARIVHNVTVKGKKGMRVHAKFRVRYGYNVPCRMIAYFYDQDGEPLEAADENYSTREGTVSASVNFTPRYDPAVYNDLQLFMPYEALNMESGDVYDLKFYLALYDKDGERFFGKSGWYNFRLNMP